MSRYGRAAKAFEDFTGRRPAKVKAAQLDDSDVVGWKLGPAVGVAYEATRDGEKARYFHEFAPAARPDLVAREDGRQLFFTGGNYTVTDHGIEDMPRLFVVNPSPRAVMRKNPTMKRNRHGQFVKGSGAPRRRHSTRQVAIFQGNPAPKRRRRRAASGAAVRHYKRNPIRRRRYRRNPSARAGIKGLGQMIVPAVGIGAGAVGTEMLMGYLPIPQSWKTGVLRQVSKGLVGLSAGWALSTFLKQKKLGFYVMAGAIVIAVHDAIKEAITAKLPAGTGAFGQYVLPLGSQFNGRRGGMGYVNPGQLTMGQYVRPPVSQFAGDAPLFHHPGGETDFQA